MEPEPNVAFTPSGARIYMTNRLPVFVPRGRDSEEQYRKRVTEAMKAYMLCTGRNTQ